MICMCITLFIRRETRNYGLIVIVGCCDKYNNYNMTLLYCTADLCPKRLGKIKQI